MQKEIYAGDTPLKSGDGEVTGERVEIGNEAYYRIANSHRMRPFFMSLVSDSNHWMFLSSNGALTAGRKDSEYALFPYYTDDKIAESLEVTGCKSIFRVRKQDREYLWEPFSQRYPGIYRIRRNLYKSFRCNKVIFEECNQDLGLTFRYQWSTSNEFGFVRRATLHNEADHPVSVRVLDGLQNILPFGVTTELQNTRSNLVDAYKKNELHPGSGLGIYALSAVIVDRAEPSEALKANTVWSAGLDNPACLVSSLQLDSFRQGAPVRQETEVKGEKGAYFVVASLELQPGSGHSWTLVANVNQGPAAVAGLVESLKDPASLLARVDRDIDAGTRRLVGLTAAADGLQETGDRLRTARHYANVMYNIMRGGIMDDNYRMEKSDFLPYIRGASHQVYKRQGPRLSGLKDSFTLFELRELAAESGDPDFSRLCLEYLPLKFSRRHGDPSRPWNKFSINTQSEKDGSKILDYQGNWRDIFQNWEALAHSYPEFIDGMIHKFLNASTADGYNPYRITKNGIDWEVIEPEDPWSYIGYWGDHQVIYLLKFLEFAEDYFPGRLLRYWDQDLFVYANVPYRIKPYEEILKNPKDTIDFDAALDREIRGRRAQAGADGALVPAADGMPYRVNLLEKLLAMLLAKVSNFIPGAGIWLNTQRPEWNDANNALVGNGVSMVTLYYLYRFLGYFQGFLDRHNPEEVAVSKELADFFTSVRETLATRSHLAGAPISDTARREIVDALGLAGSTYREAFYRNGFSGKRTGISRGELMEFIRAMQAFSRHTIAANRRADRMYHSYNLISIGADSIAVSHLSEMLEGQVAALSSGYLDPEESLELLVSMRNSALYREDQNSYILYPDRQLPDFLNKNLIPSGRLAESALLTMLVEAGNTQIVEQDASGACHFNGNFNNAARLEAALSELPDEFDSLVSRDRQLLLDIYEEVFDHKSFTGRSGTFFAYEGLGSIYWHMVSKLSLAVQETCLKAIREKTGPETIQGLAACYHEINEGIGVHKSPALYGAFPTDPYSHTPAHRGAQQPGMTGQVKEDILTRLAELGIHVASGSLRFGPYLFGKEEFAKDPFRFEYMDTENRQRTLEVPGNSLAFTYCQVPVVYTRTDRPFLKVHLSDDSVAEQQETLMGPDLSREVFGRTGKVLRLHVGVDY